MSMAEVSVFPGEDQTLRKKGGAGLFSPRKTDNPIPAERKRGHDPFFELVQLINNVPFSSSVNLSRRSSPDLKLSLFMVFLILPTGVHIPVSLSPKKNADASCYTTQSPALPPGEYAWRF